MSFDWYDSYYGTYLGAKIKGTIGKKYIYQVVENIQRKYRYYDYINPDSPEQQRFRDLLRKAVQSWHSLSSDEKLFYDGNIPSGKTMSGFNFYVSSYINNYK